MANYCVVLSIMRCCRGTCQVVFIDGILSAEASLAVLWEGGLDLRPQLLVDQSLVLAVLPGPSGHALPAHGTAQRTLVHRFQEATLTTKTCIGR